MTSYRIVEPRRNPRLHTLINAISGAIISQHRTHAAAVAAAHRHLSAVRRERGPDAYVVYTITPPATPLTEDTLRDAYEFGGPTAVLDLCAPHDLPSALCEPCEDDTPTWQGVCAVCWTAR